jgi:hypothetical protein
MLVRQAAAAAAAATALLHMLLLKDSTETAVSVESSYMCS